MLIMPIIAGIYAISLAIYFALRILRRKVDSNDMADVAFDIRTGANAYLLRQAKTILLITPLLFILLYFFLGWKEALTAVLGVLSSLLAGYLGMFVCVRANLQTADIAKESSSNSFKTAFLAGGFTGLCITGISLTILALLYKFFNSPLPLVGFGFGASLAALFAQIGGGIFTKSADVGADLVGKLEMKIPEDDPRNAAVVADLVGDNVGDCAGRGADLFESFSDDIITGTIVASTLIPKYGAKVIFFPLLLQSIGVVSSSLSILFTKTKKGSKNQVSTFNRGLALNSILAIILSFIVVNLILGDLTIWLATVLGVIVTLIAAFTTRLYAGMESQTVKEIAEAAKRGPALNLITGLGYGLQSPIISILMIVSAIILAFNSSRSLLFAIVAVNIGTDLLIGYIMASDAFGPVVDNASGIAEMAKAPKEIVNSLSSLDSVGNTMKATTKSYAMSSGTVTAFVIFATFFSLTNVKFLDVSSPKFLGFLFVGITLPFFISSLVIKSTAKTAVLMVDEVRRQFEKIKGLLEEKAKPDYGQCIDIATKNALKEMIFPGIICIVTPLSIGLTFGAGALGSLLIGSVASSALLGPFFNNVGTSLDNAKKLIEDEEGQRGSYSHAAAVVGDTVGDPLKDVAGPSLSIFMKLIGMTSLLVAQFLP